MKLNLRAIPASKLKINLKNMYIMVTTRTLGFFAMLMFTLAFIGCNKDDASISQEFLEETTFAENVFAQLSSDIEDAVPLEGISSGRGGFMGFGFGFGKCMTRTVETPEEADYPKTITIVYDGECTSGFKQVVKSGTIVITLTGPRKEEGAQRIVTFEDFTINGNEVTGTKTYTYLGNGQFTVTLEDGNIITKDGDVIIRESTKTRTLIEGGETEDRSDDVYEVTGEINGVHIDSETGDELSYKKVITSPLISSKDCFWITSGVVETIIDGETVTTVDFGDGTCDDIATRTNVGEEPAEFTMDMKIHKKWRHKFRNKD